MMIRTLLTLGVAAAAAGAEAPRLPSRIAFGSCAKQDKPLPVLRAAIAANPDFFVFLGDNIYGDTDDMDVLKAKYAVLGAKPEFRALREAMPLHAIWDDHDYGRNDAGKEYPMKEASKEVFLDFWGEPAGTARRGRPGIYASHRWERDGRVLQLVLLDTRTFRDPLRRNPKKNREAPFKNDYRTDPDPAKTFLGAAQWKWLEGEFRKPADLRVVATSIQFGHEYNGWESWTNLPAEHARMIELIRGTRANGVVFISGDVHWGEISVRDVEGGYPLHDVTSSALNQTWDPIEPNKFRHGKFMRDPNFGLLVVDWEKGTLAMQIRGEDGQVAVGKSVRLAELRFP
ncbi:MAG: alkaline phosphatase family protein [Akkermansiaceae bacterium]|nr:alkaline phosphatase family protein [Akkermansiaceae bacterium]NNM28472.1 alkaline phosphatase family protein [Akkermansiaceae bacterium]